MISFDEYDINIILFGELFNNIQFNTINEISSQYRNINYTELKSDIKRLLLHFIIKESCDTINNSNHKNIILVINSSIINEDFEIWSILDKHMLLKFIKDSFKSLRNKLPFPVYILDEDINFDNMSGELIDILHEMHREVDTFSIKHKTSRKLRGFSNQKGLKYLTENYLVSGEFKKLLYK